MTQATTAGREPIVALPSPAHHPDGPYVRYSIYQKHSICTALFMILSCFNSERELVMDLERLKLAKSVKPKKSRDKVCSGFTLYHYQAIRGL